MKFARKLNKKLVPLAKEKNKYVSSIYISFPFFYVKKFKLAILPLMKHFAVKPV